MNGALNSAVTTLACNETFFFPTGCAGLVCRQALGSAHPQPPDKVSGWLRAGVKIFTKKRDMIHIKVATIVIDEDIVSH